MRDVAEAVRPDVRTAIAPVVLYPFRRLGSVPTFHAQLYAASETPGRPSMLSERDGLLYFHIYAVREEDIDETYAAVKWLNGHFEPAGAGDVVGIHYRLASANLLEEEDGTLHLAVLYSTRYYREAA